MKSSIYDLCKNKWMMKGHLPRNFMTPENNRMFLCKCSIYCLGNIEPWVKVIVGFNIRDGTSTMILLPI